MAVAVWGRSGIVQGLVFMTLSLPLAWVVWAGLMDGLGPDPAKALVDFSGLWAFRLLLVCLAMTPLRHLTQSVSWVRFRRMLGLFAFFYAVIHVMSYAFLLFGGRWSDVVVELTRRPYIMAGGASFLLLLPLALTSTRGWQRRLGKHWAALHRLVYPAAILDLVHFAWAQKLGFQAVWMYGLGLALLLGIRIWRRNRQKLNFF